MPPAPPSLSQEDYPLSLFLLPTWAVKPLLIAVTDRLDPQFRHSTKYSRFSPFSNLVFGLLHVLQVTYSTMYRLRTFSICFCWNRPLMTSRFDPSTLPLVPTSANKNCV